MENQKQEAAEDSKGFIVGNKAWYMKDRASDLQVYIGLFGQEHDGSWNGHHFLIEWDESQTPKLHAYNDEWHLLSIMSEVIEQLAKWDSKDISQDDLIKFLLKQGYRDFTEYDDPDRDELEALREYALSKLTDQEKAALGLYAAEPTT